MRVFDRRQLLALDGSGVDGVIREVFESSIAMGLTALRNIDVDPSEMDDVEATLRDLDETRLQAQIDEGVVEEGLDHRREPRVGVGAGSQDEKIGLKPLAAEGARDVGELGRAHRGTTTSKADVDSRLP